MICTEGDAVVLGRFRVAVSHCPLHLGSAADRIYYAGELREHSIAGVLYDAPSMLLDLRIDEIAEMPLEPFVRAFLIRTHQGRMACHVSGKGRGETAGRSHGSGSPPLVGWIEYGLTRAQLAHHDMGAAGRPPEMPLEQHARRA